MAEPVSRPPVNTPSATQWRPFTRLLLALLFTLMAAAIGLLLYDAYLGGGFSGNFPLLLHVIYGLLTLVMLCLPSTLMWLTRSIAKWRGRPAPEKYLKQLEAVRKVQLLMGVALLFFWLMTLTTLVFEVPLVICAMMCLIAALIILNLTNRWANKDANATAAPIGSWNAGAPGATQTPLPSPATSPQHLTRRTAIVGIIGGVGALTAAIAFPLWTLLRPHILFGDGGGIWTVAWSPDGQRIASGSDAGVAHIWDARTGTDVAAYHFPPPANAWAYNTVTGVAWSPDSSRIAAASSDSTVRIIDAQTRKAILTYRGHTDFVSCVAWSHDGTRIASGADTVHVWDATTGQRMLVYAGQTDGISSVAWSADDQQIASAGENDGTVQIWNAVTGATNMIYRGHLNVLGLNGVNTLAWSAKTGLIASADTTVQIWSPE